MARDSAVRERLIKNWSKCLRAGRPFIYPEDHFLRAAPGRYCTIRFRERRRSSKKAAKDNNLLHVDLLPVPYVGCLETAKVFVLMRNPGFHDSDYSAEAAGTAFRREYQRTLKQTNERSEYPFAYLDPRFASHAGARYWLRKFSKLLHKFSERWRSSWNDTLRRFSRSVAVLQYLPYHSGNFDAKRRWYDQLQSVKDICAFVRDDLVPRAKAGEVLILAVRGTADWILPARQRNIIRYRGTESLFAHLTPGSKGGKAILRFLSG